MHFCFLLQQENLENEMPESLKAKHEVIISELKAQLDDLESFAYKQVHVKNIDFK